MIALREYQRIAIDRLRLAVKAGARAPLLVSPTGSGKTVLGAEIVRGHVARGGTVNWYAHRRELVQQAATTLRAFGLDVSAQGLNVGAPVRVLSIQGVLSSGEVPACSLAFFDEAHHISAGAEEWSKIAEAHRDAIIVGATATPQRGDGSPLSPPFDRMVVVAQIPDLIRLGHLTPVEVIRPSRRLKSGRIAQRPVDAYQRHTPGQRAVVFAPHVAAAKAFAEEFQAAGIDARVVHGGTPSLERSETLQAFADGRIRVVINVMVLTEGFDAPPTSCVIIARSVGSASMYLQMIGRGMRTSPGKRVCIVLDLAGCSHTFGPPDQEWEYSLDGEGIAKKGAVTGERLCRMCGAPLGDTVICAECGRDYTAESIEVTGEPIDKFAWIKRDTPEQRVNRMVKWLQARKPGTKAIAVKYKARAVYGSVVESEWRTALVLAKG